MAKRSSRQYVWGVLLIVFGAILLSQELYNIQILSWLWKFWPALLIIWGVKILSDSRSSK